MKFGILGTGMVGEALASKLVALGHEVKMGARSAGNEKARAWVDKTDSSRASQGSFADAAAFGDIVINAVQGAATLSVVEAVIQPLADKVLIDVANPFDFSKGMPPTLFVSNDSSLAEAVQALAPRTKVVKTLNTMSAALMTDPSAVPGDHDVFVSGNDAAAKAHVIELLRSFGWKAPIDLGDLSSARGTESMMLAWMRLWSALGTHEFNFHIARK
ncbi:NAD(P)-binding domain-containing protein [Schlegelella sp. S2-27]|uniref:NAD(P)-binding domain-containing protein n=1 Tax=Caldimonas mangrovi TaxID=2944811 RepID=A0ABT0YUA6_9BURK|nr:NAD(P)-binding domain-containing protein [Caldimonas mangrovi]MCM5682330.1 NAD(P)-binding domain-containing protein [Caldimonas mangrovi]